MKLLKNTLILFVCSIFFLCYFPVLILAVIIDVLTGLKLLETKIGYYLTLFPHYVAENWLKIK